MSKAALIRLRELKEVFGQVSASNFEAILARLAVLYEDLRIELYGIAEDSIPALEKLDVKYRRIYFLRKSIGTLSEFSEAVAHLQMCPEFTVVSVEFSPEIRRYWERAAGFFKRNDRRLRMIRNDTGGHFGLEAARHAVHNFGVDAVMGIEMREPFTKRHTVFLHFAGEVVSTAMLRHAEGMNRDYQVRRLIRLARVGYRHAVRCVLCVVSCYLWDKFG